MGVWFSSLLPIFENLAVGDPVVILNELGDAIESVRVVLFPSFYLFIIFEFATLELFFTNKLLPFIGFLSNF